MKGHFSGTSPWETKRIGGNIDFCKRHWQTTKVTFHKYTHTCGGKNSS